MSAEPRWLRDLFSGAALLLTLMWPAVSVGETVYKWVDESGVVHFSDSPPSGKQAFEELVIGPPAISHGEMATNAGDTATGEAKTGGAAPEGAKAQTPPNGPAKVILTSQSALPRGVDARHLVGVVKNVGGERASHVRVNAHIADPQGNECQNEDVEVVPSDLGPGESGNFDSTVRSPCLINGGSVDAAAVWD